MISYQSLLLSTTVLNDTCNLFFVYIVITVGVLDEVQTKLKNAYKRICSSDNPHCYIQLALVRDEICNIHDKRLNEITKHTLQGQVDKILKIKEPLERGLEDIFHYNDSPCPRLILILGAPGNNIICVTKLPACLAICVPTSNFKGIIKDRKSRSKG